MNLHLAAFSAVATMAATLPAVAGPACEARSGPNTAALVELYSSEGCSSCPPADRQLSLLPQTLDPAAQAVPLALHVGYWDNLGWADPYAQDRFAQRQAWLVQANKRRTVYTPQVFVGGIESQAWQSPLKDAVRRLNAIPAAATIRLRAVQSADGMLTLDVEAEARAGADPTSLYLAIAENGLVSKIMAGENRGATLTHDHVVREWIGPIRLRDDATRTRRRIGLSPTWHRDRLEVVAFVQDERTGSVLQALRAGSCTGA